jgi:hypothetical protein
MATLIKLKGTVTNGERVYDRPEIKKMILDELEGKRFEEIVKKEHIEKTDKQRAYYFGGIIAGTCMRSLMFDGWTKDEIDIHFRKLLRAYKAVRTINSRITIEDRHDSIADYNVDEMSLFLEDVLNYLARFEIYPLPSDEYELKKYTLK